MESEVYTEHTDQYYCASAMDHTVVGSGKNPRLFGLHIKVSQTLSYFPPTENPYLSTTNPFSEKN